MWNARLDGARRVEDRRPSGDPLPRDPLFLRSPLQRVALQRVMRLSPVRDGDRHHA